MSEVMDRGGPIDRELAARVEHTCLKPTASGADIERLCTDAIAAGLFAVCVNPVHVPVARRALAGAEPRLVSVVGFPLGANHTETKAAECARVVAEGADEIDMVAPLWALGDRAAFVRDVRAVVGCAEQRPVKVILETGLLDDEQKRWAARCCVEAGAAFVKTCTGFAVGRAEPGDIVLLRETLAGAAGIKASGGIRSAAQARALVAAGADRIGTSAGVDLVSSA